MPGVGVALELPDIGLFSDFEATRVELPRMSGQQRTDTFEATTVRFEGDVAPTPFAGEGEDRVYALMVRYSQDEHSQLADLLDLFRTAHRAADQRIMVRPNAYAFGDLNEIEVGIVAGEVASPAGGRAWDVTFTFTTVKYSLEV